MTKQIICTALVLVSLLACDTIKDEVNDKLDERQSSFVEADVLYDGKSERIKPNVCNPFRALDFYTINATTIDNAPLIGVSGTFKNAGEIVRSEETDIFMVFRKATGNDKENLYNSTINGPNFRESEIKITVDRIEGKIVSGTFEGVLYNENGDSAVVKNGFFDATTTL